MNGLLKFRPLEILLVEDNEADIRLTQEVFKDSKVFNNISVVVDRAEALLYLDKKERYKSVSRQDIILLDINLPGKDGREELAEVKADEELKQIPVVVFSTSSSGEDILKSYNLHASCYISKPVDVN